MAMSDLSMLLKNARPRLRSGKYYMATVKASDLPRLTICIRQIAGIYREKEGLSILLSEGIKPRIECLTKQPVIGPFALITMTVQSDLMAIGFMAAMAKALAGNGISCNAVSAYYHDHILVPWERKGRALETLRSLSG